MAPTRQEQVFIWSHILWNYYQAIHMLTAYVTPTRHFRPSYPCRPDTTRDTTRDTGRIRHLNNRHFFSVTGEIWRSPEKSRHLLEVDYDKDITWKGQEQGGELKTMRDEVVLRKTMPKNAEGRPVYVYIVCINHVLYKKCIWTVLCPDSFLKKRFDYSCLPRHKRKQIFIITLKHDLTTNIFCLMYTTSDFLLSLL